MRFKKIIADLGDDMEVSGDGGGDGKGNPLSSRWGGRRGSVISAQANLDGANLSLTAGGHHSLEKKGSMNTRSLLSSILGTAMRSSVNETVSMTSWTLIFRAVGRFGIILKNVRTRLVAQK